MERSDCIELGYISRAHGLKGEVRVMFDVEDIQDYAQAKSFYLSKDQGALEAYQVKTFHVASPQEAILRFAHHRYRDQAEALRGYTLFFPIEKLPSLPEGSFYFFELEGWEVQDRRHGSIGTAGPLKEIGPNRLLVVYRADKKVLIPTHPHVLLRADFESHIVHVDLPEGLLELFD